MTVRGKPGKPKTGFPPFPPPLEIPEGFPHSHRFDCCPYIRTKNNNKEPGEAKTASP
jgi:hypothetical protein